MNEYKTDFTWEDYYVLKDEKIVEALPSYMPEAIQHQLPQNENVLIYALRGAVLTLAIIAITRPNRSRLIKISL